MPAHFRSIINRDYQKAQNNPCLSDRIADLKAIKFLCALENWSTVLLWSRSEDFVTGRKGIATGWMTGNTFTQNNMAHFNNGWSRFSWTILISFNLFTHL